MNVSLRLTGQQHAELMDHLFPGDGKEAVALVLCGRRNAGSKQILTAYQIHTIAHDDCRERAAERVSWETRLIDPMLEEALSEGLGFLKVHSHPGGYSEFSEFDDASDSALFPTFYRLFEDGLPHASAVMLPHGEMFGRHVREDGSFQPLERISVAGDDIWIWDRSENLRPLPEFADRNARAFGEETTRKFGSLTIGVVGLSGLGGPLIEQLGRLGPRKLVFVDPETVDETNRNRIPGTRKADVGRLKTEVQERVIAEIGMETQVVSFSCDLAKREVVLALAKCDIVFGCMDEAGGRHLLNRLCSTYSIPYFDLGVRLVADGKGDISHVCGTVHYLQPDRSSLLSRGLYTLDDVRADALRRANPSEYETLRAEKYISGVAEARPAVGCVNTFFASLGVLELVARLHPYRLEPNSKFAAYEAMLHVPCLNPRPEGERCPVVTREAGRGDMEPLLDMPVFSQIREAA